MMQIVANGLLAGAIYAMVAMGFAVVLQAGRFLDFAFAGSLLMAAYAADYLAEFLDTPLPVLLAVGPIAAALTSALFSHFIYRPLRNRDSSSLVLVIASLGLLVVSVNLVSMLFGDSPRTLQNLQNVSSFSVGSARVTLLQSAIMCSALIVAVLSWCLVCRTRWGIMLRALAGDESLAICLGVDRDKTVLQAVAYGAAVAGLAATFAALDTGVTPSLGFQLLLPGVVSTIAGGVGNPAGAALSGFAVGMVQQFGGWYLGTAWQDAILFLILIVFLLIRPHGLFGHASRKGNH